jgi:hypothetical protein
MLTSIFTAKRRKIVFSFSVLSSDDISFLSDTLISCVMRGAGLPPYSPLNVPEERRSRRNSLRGDPSGVLSAAAAALKVYKSRKLHTYTNLFEHQHHHLSTYTNTIKHLHYYLSIYTKPVNHHHHHLSMRHL